MAVTAAARGLPARAVAGAGAGPQARLIPVERAFDPAPPAGGPPAVIPVPRQATYPPGVLPIAGLAVRVEGDAPELRRAAHSFEQAVSARFPGATLTRASGSGDASIVITMAGDERSAALAAGGESLARQPEGYALHVGRDGARVVGAGGPGALMGVQTLIQLLVNAPGGPGLRYADIADWPAFPVRMAMIYLDAYSFGINDRLIPLLAHLKYNGLLVMADYVRWDSAPAIWHPLGATKSEARRIAALARAEGLEPVPLIELLGHVQWLFYGGANRDLLQDPASSEPFAYDPLNPRTYQVILPILDEAIEVFRPRYVHVGHDEVRNVVRFPATERGKAMGFARLFFDDVMRLHDHLASRGVGTMMWQDVAFSDATKEMVQALPKDVVFTSWHYQPGDDFPAIREIRRAGFPVLGASWYQPGNAEGLAASAWRDGASGMLQTRWTGYFGNPSIVDGEAEQVVAYVRAAASFWNPQAPISDDLAAAALASSWAPAAWRAVPGRLVDLSPHVTRALVDDESGSGWIGKGPGYDLAPLAGLARGGPVRLGPYEFYVTGAVMTRANRGPARDLPETVTVPLNARAAGLAVLHTTAWPAPAPGKLAGTYTLRYEDGTSFEQPLQYGREIAAWTETSLDSLLRYPAWRGVTSEGLRVGVDVLEMRNPHPEKTIAAFAVTSGVRWANPVVLGLTLLDEVPVRRPVRPFAPEGEVSR